MRFFLVSVAALGANLVVLHLLVVREPREAPRAGRRDRPRDAARFIGNKLWSFRRAKA
jgi:hypothetical protein